MLKRRFSAAFLAVAVMCTSVFTSCKKDSPDDKPPEAVMNSQEISSESITTEKSAAKENSVSTSESLVSDAFEKEVPVNDDSEVSDSEWIALEDIVVTEHFLADSENINVKSAINRDSEAPVALNSFDTPDFGTRIPEYCKGYDSEVTDENGVTHYTGIGSDGTPRIDYLLVSNGHTYFWVNYDNDVFSHEWAIFDYNMETTEFNEIYTYSSVTDECSDVYYMQYVNGKLYIQYQLNSKTYEYVEDGNVDYYDVNVESLGYEIVSIDVASHESKVIYENKDAESYIHSYISTYEEELYLSECLEADYENNRFEYSTLKYDEKNDKWTEIEGTTYTTTIAMADPETNELILSDGVGHEIHTGREYNENHYIGILGYDDKCMIWREGTNDDAMLYKYDYESETMYSVDISGIVSYFGADYVSGGNVILTSSTLVYYLIPELGMTFVLTRMGNYGNYVINDGIFAFTGTEGAGYNNKNEKVFWLELE